MPEILRSASFVRTAESAATDVRLRLIATSDLHACLFSYDYCANRPLPDQGLIRISRRIAEARAEVSNALLFDNGDFLQGNPLAEYVASSPRRRRPHPVIAAFNTLKYDAVTLGNHEFNFGLSFLSAALSTANFPVISANVVESLGNCPAEDRHYVPPFALLSRTVQDVSGNPQHLKIGVIGFAPPQIEVWDRDHLKGKIRTRDILTTARTWLPRLKALGADIIVVLAHSGIGPADADERSENAATALAALPEVDAVIAGHSHLLFPSKDFIDQGAIDSRQGKLAGKPAIMPGSYGSHIGVIDLVLVPRPRNGLTIWSVQHSTSKLIEAGPQTEASPIARKLHTSLAADHRATLTWSRQIVGHTGVALHTYFSSVVPCAAMQVISQAKLAFARESLKGTSLESLPLLALATPFRNGGRSGPMNYTDIPTGSLRMRNLSDLYMYPNTLEILRMSGAELARWLEQSSSVFHRIAPGQRDVALVDEEVPSFFCDSVPNLSYEIDLAQAAQIDHFGRPTGSATRRIKNIRYQGQPLCPEASVLVVTNSHRSSRSPSGTSTDRHKVVMTSGYRAIDAIRGFLRSGKAGAPAAPSWQIGSMPGTSVIIKSGANSNRHLADIARFSPEDLGLSDDGFRRYRLHL